MIFENFLQNAMYNLKKSPILLSQFSKYIEKITQCVKITFSTKFQLISSSYLKSLPKITFPNEVLQKRSKICNNFRCIENCHWKIRFQSRAHMIFFIFFLSYLDKTLIIYTKL